MTKLANKVRKQWELRYVLLYETKAHPAMPINELIRRVQQEETKRGWMWIPSTHKYVRAKTKWETFWDDFALFRARKKAERAKRKSDREMKKLNKIFNQYGKHQD